MNRKQGPKLEVLLPEGPSLTTELLTRPAGWETQQVRVRARVSVTIRGPGSRSKGLLSFNNKGKGFWYSIK